MIFKDKVFDFLKWINLIAIPALATAYSQLANIFGWRYGEEVAEVAVIICTLLGTLLGISNYQYYHTLPESMEIPEEQKVDEFENHEDGGVM